MNHFDFLEKHDFFLKKVPLGSQVAYAFKFNDDTKKYLGIIFIPKSFEFELEWECNHLGYSEIERFKDMPKWFQKLYQQVESALHTRDRLRKIVIGRL